MSIICELFERTAREPVKNEAGQSGDEREEDKILKQNAGDRNCDGEIHPT